MEFSNLTQKDTFILENILRVSRELEKLIAEKAELEDGILQGGDAVQIAHAAAMAMKNLLGLVCDPVAGLVEIPCVKRNVIGAMNALSCTDMAMAGIVSKIPPDQVIDAMKSVGDKMDVSLRETAGGGLAQTPAGLEVSKKLLQD